jgi:hypothetical protein
MDLYTKMSAPIEQAVKENPDQDPMDDEVPF